MIIINLTGGLGNQMFQYAFGRYLSIKHNTSLKYHYTNALFNTQRSYELDNFNVQITQASQKDLKALKIFTNRYINRILYLIDERFGIQFNNNIITERYPYTFNKKYLDIPNNSYVQGFWNNEKYFEPIKKIIKKEFVLRRKLDNRSYSLKKKNKKN